MDLLQLRYFYESSKNENFSATAQKYTVPPSSVSAAIKRLENELGHQLFDRSANKIKLNHNGKILYTALDGAFSQIDNAISTIRFSNKQKVNLNVLIKARSAWITSLIFQFKRLYPNVFFYITNNPETNDFESFDIIIDELTPIYENYESFLLSTEELCIKASKSSSLVGKKLTLKDISNHPFVLIGKGNAMYRLLEKISKREGFVPNIAIECTDRQCMLNYVENNLGLTIGSVNSLQEDSQKGITALNITDFNEQQLVYVYFQKNKTKNSALNRFIEFLKKEIKV